MNKKIKKVLIITKQVALDYYKKEYKTKNPEKLKKILKEKMKTPIVDAGMLRILSGSNFFAILKGLVDSGLEIECKKEVFPTEDRISGKHLKEDFSKTFSEIKLKIEKI